jgi:hypothetical protein
VGSDGVQGEHDAALTLGLGSIVSPDSVLNRFKTNQIYFKRIQICPKCSLIQKVYFLASKIQNKIWLERD